MFEGVEESISHTLEIASPPEDNVKAMLLRLLMFILHNAECAFGGPLWLSQKRKEAPGHLQDIPQNAATTALSHSLSAFPASSDQFLQTIAHLR